jgi:hypothetical protein
MPEISGEIVRITTYEEPAPTDGWLALSKVLWFAIWILIPVSLYRFLDDAFGTVHAVVGVILFLFIFRLIGPLNFIILDEFLSRILPDMRSAIRIDRIRIYDFRLRDAKGTILACILRGPLRGVAPMRGDRIRVDTKFRQGVYTIRNGWNETTGSRLAPQGKPSLWILFITIGLLVLQVLYLRGLLDEWLYPWLAEVLTMFMGEV